MEINCSFCFYNMDPRSFSESCIHSASKRLVGLESSLMLLRQHCLKFSNYLCVRPELKQGPCLIIQRSELSIRHFPIVLRGAYTHTPFFCICRPPYLLAVVLWLHGHGAQRLVPCISPEHLRVTAARGWKTQSVSESFWFGTMSWVSQTS